MAVTIARVTLWDTTGTDRGRGDVTAVINDAGNVGVGAYANAAGSCHFTLPYNHPLISTCIPRLTHYRISRVSPSGETTVGVGLLDDFDATENEVVFYGLDYLGLFDRSITPSDTSYTDADIGTIIEDEAKLARDSSATSHPDANSVLGFLTMGTFDTTSLAPASIISAFQPRLQFIQSLISTWSGSNSTPVRPLFSVTRDPTFTVSFDKDAGSDQTGMHLEYRSTVTHFRYIPGWAGYRTAMHLIGQKRDGAAVLYSDETGGSPSTYGISEGADLILDVADQTTLDNMAKHELRVSQRIGKKLTLTIQSGALAPWDGYDLADSIPISISRGPVSLSRALYTLTGLQWEMAPDGTEDLQLQLQPKDT